MEIHPFHKYKAKVNYIDDTNLKEPHPENGQVVFVEAQFRVEKGYPFEGDWAMWLVEPQIPYWIPSRELVLLEDMGLNEFKLK